MEGPRCGHGGLAVGRASVADLAAAKPAERAAPAATTGGHVRAAEGVAASAGALRRGGASILGTRWKGPLDPLERGDVVRRRGPIPEEGHELLRVRPRAGRKGGFFWVARNLRGETPFAPQRNRGVRDLTCRLGTRGSWHHGPKAGIAQFA